MADDAAETLRFGFVRGTAPAKWAQRWRGTGEPPLEMLPLGDVYAPADRESFDVVLERVPPGAVPVGSDGEKPGRHAVRLYEEAVALVVPADRETAPSAANETIETSEAALESIRFLDYPGLPEQWPQAAGWNNPEWVPTSIAAALDLVAAGAGNVLLPLPLARHLTNKHQHLVLPVVAALPGTEIWVTWSVERDDPTIQHLIGVLRGRTPRSSRNSTPPPPRKKTKQTKGTKKSPRQGKPGHKNRGRGRNSR